MADAKVTQKEESSWQWPDSLYKKIYEITGVEVLREPKPALEFKFDPISTFSEDWQKLEHEWTEGKGTFIEFSHVMQLFICSFCETCWTEAEDKMIARGDKGCRTCRPRENSEIKMTPQMKELLADLPKCYRNVILRGKW